MLRYDRYLWLRLKKRVQISSTKYCHKVTYYHMRPFASTVGGKKQLELKRQWELSNARVVPFSKKECGFAVRLL